MNYEQMYKDALDRAKFLKENTDGVGAKDVSKCFEEIFPELKENEDERIKGAIVDHLKDCNLMEWATWLEKQGEQKPYTFNTIPRLLGMIKPTDRVKEYCQKLIDSLEKEGYKKDAKIVDGILKQWNGEKVPMATTDEQDKQEFADKVEQTFFKAGNWYLCVKDFLGNCGVRFDKGHAYYCGHDGCLQEFDSSARIAIDERLYDYFNLWTIGDAKPGDVISFNDGHGNDCIEVIKSITNKKIEFWFCLTNGNCYEAFDGITPYTNLASREGATPANKEQCDLLFQKMKEAGYEWDDTKKVLKTIEKNSTWIEKDEKIRKALIHLISEQDGFLTAINGISVKDILDWLKKQDAQTIKEALRTEYEKGRADAIAKRWKPSSTDIILLERIANGKSITPDFQTSLSVLIYQLKKLIGD